MIKRWSVIPIAIVASLMLTACSSSKHEPTLLMSEVQQKIQQAQTQGAPLKAPIPFNAAQENMRLAQEANARGDYTEAAALLDVSLAEAEYAIAKTEAETAQEAADQVSQGLKQLEQEVNN